MSTPEGQFHWGTGRRKTAVARVRIRRGTGRILVNGRDADAYFVTDRARNGIRAPLRAAKCLTKFDVYANVKGGGVNSQSGALLLGIARALCDVDPDHKQVLKDGGFLTHDSREKERKKYGRRGARAGVQFSKR